MQCRWVPAGAVAAACPQACASSQSPFWSAAGHGHEMPMDPKQRRFVRCYPTVSLSALCTALPAHAPAPLAPATGGPEHLQPKQLMRNRPWPGLQDCR